MVRLNECSSYRGFELSSDFCEKVLVKVQREFKNSSSYWKCELSGVRVIGSVLQRNVSVLFFSKTVTGNKIIRLLASA